MISLHSFQPVLTYDPMDLFEVTAGNLDTLLEEISVKNVSVEIHCLLLACITVFSQSATGFLELASL